MFMKIAVINFSGNVGKTTVARHLLLPRIEAAEFIAVETLNTGVDHGQALRGSEFRELQTYLQTVDNAVVDIGASNIEEFMARMHRYENSHEDFDCFVVPTVSPLKQQQDTIATIAELSQLGIPPERLRIVFNMVERGAAVEKLFSLLLAFLAKQPLACANVLSRIGMNELYERIKGSGKEVADVARDTTDYKAQIAKARSLPEKIALADQLANRRLAAGVLPELDACFSALWRDNAALESAPAAVKAAV
jgi:hypothetical protein